MICHLSLALGAMNLALLTYLARRVKDAGRR